MSNLSWTFKDEDFKRIWARVSAYTMTSPERGYARIRRSDTLWKIESLAPLLSAGFGAAALP